MKRWTLALVAACAALGGSLFVAKGKLEATAPRSTALTDAGQSPAAAGATRAEVNALRSEVVTLKRALNDVRNEQTTLAAASQAASVEPEDAPAEQATARQAKPKRDALAELSARLAAEPVDGEWSAQASRKIRDSMAANVPATAVLETECGSSMCRVLLEHRNAEDQSKLSFAIAELEAFRDGVYYDYDHTASPPRTTLIVLRPGASFLTEEEAALAAQSP